MPNIYALNSDTHTLFLSILILNSQCAGVAIEGMDIRYMGLTVLSLSYTVLSHFAANMRGEIFPVCCEIFQKFSLDNS